MMGLPVACVLTVLCLNFWWDSYVSMPVLGLPLMPAALSRHRTFLLLTYFTKICVCHHASITDEEVVTDPEVGFKREVRIELGGACVCMELLLSTPGCRGN